MTPKEKAQWAKEKAQSQTPWKLIYYCSACKADDPNNCPCDHSGYKPITLNDVLNALDSAWMTKSEE